MVTYTSWTFTTLFGTLCQSFWCTLADFLGVFPRLYVRFFGTLWYTFWYTLVVIWVHFPTLTRDVPSVQLHFFGTLR